MGSDDKYTDPQLKKEVESTVKKESKGGGPGAWSAYKAKRMSDLYKEKGGGYKDDEDKQKKTDSESTKGSGAKGHKKEDQKPEQQSEKQRAESNSNKDDDDNATSEQEQGNDKEDIEEDEGGADETENGDDCEEQARVESDDPSAADGSTSTGQKRRRGRQANGTNKKQKDDSKSTPGTSKESVGSKHQPAEEPAPRGSADRLPKNGQKVQWKALPGYVAGSVLEIVQEERTVEGKQVKGSKGDPRIVLKSESSGKICVHKPEAVFFD
ncbi:hypothetical protein MBLNU459_g5502t1 [Dothideomycetes sp. NU459]